MQNFGGNLRITLHAESETKISAEFCVYNVGRNLCGIPHADVRLESPQNSACRISAEIFAEATRNEASENELSQIAKPEINDPEIDSSRLPKVTKLIQKDTKAHQKGTKSTP